MRLSKLQIDLNKDSFEVVIKHPITGENTDIKIFLKNLYNPKNKDLQKKLTAFQGVDEKSQEEQDKANKDMAKLISEEIIVGWENILDDDDKKIKFSPETAFELLTNDENLFIVAQISQGMNDTKNFMKSAS